MDDEKWEKKNMMQESVMIISAFRSFRLFKRRKQQFPLHSVSGPGHQRQLLHSIFIAFCVVLLDAAGEELLSVLTTARSTNPL